MTSELLGVDDVTPLLEFLDREFFIEGLSFIAVTAPDINDDDDRAVVVVFLLRMIGILVTFLPVDVLDLMLRSADVIFTALSLLPIYSYIYIYIYIYYCDIIMSIYLYSTFIQIYNTHMYVEYYKNDT